MRLITLILLGLSFLFSCRTEQKTVTKADLDGYYEQQGEGEIVQFNDSLVIFYNSSSFNCYTVWQMPRADFSTQSPTVQVIDENTFTNQEGYTILTYKKMMAPPTNCQDLTEDQEKSNTYNFETLWHTFNDQYAFFQERNIDWQALKAKYQAQFTEETLPFEFYLLLEQMVLELKDDHTDFEVPDEFDEQWHRLHQKKDTTDYRDLVINKILDHYVQEVQKYNGGQVAWGKVGERIAYVQLNGMNGLADYQVDNAADYWEKAEESDDHDQDLIDGAHTIASRIVNEIQEMDACIIDLRFNPGGYDWLGLAFMSHFIDQDYEVFKKKRRFQDGFSDYQVIDIQAAQPAYLKPVYLLTSPYTVSAAETTTIATMAFPNFTRVGSRTLGALSDILYKGLPNGWVYFFSNEIYETMDGQLFEVKGVPPDHEIDYLREEDAFLQELHKELDLGDRALEKVKELVKN